MKKLLFMFMFLVSAQFIFAQVTLTGTITDAASGMQLPGVSVIEVGTTNGTITGEDGKYSIEVTTGSTVRFSFIGFKGHKVVASESATVNVDLKEDSEILEDVIVVGYGVEKKSLVTGAISHLNR